MENLLVVVFFLGAILMIVGGATGSMDLGGLGILLLIVATLVSVGTGQGSSFGPNATHSSRFPYRRKGGRRR